MLRLLHTADIHLGARHSDLGERAAAQRERQFAAFRRSVDVALEERVDLFLIAGDLLAARLRILHGLDGEQRRLGLDVMDVLGIFDAGRAIARVPPGLK